MKIKKDVRRRAGRCWQLAAGGGEATILALLLWDKLGGKFGELLGMARGAIFILRK